MHARTPNGSVNFSFNPATAGLLAANNVIVASIANNHTYDKGAAGYDHTKKVLNAVGLLTPGHPKKVGGGQGASANEFVSNFSKNGVSVAFVSFNAFDPSFDREKALAQVAALRASLTATTSTTFFIEVNIHWGTEYETHSNATQQALAHDLIDAGADVIFGHHPHVTQEMEIYRGKHIFYSLGNFIFDQYFSKEVQEGLTVKTSWYADGPQFELDPIRSIKSQPELLQGAEKEAWLGAYF